MPTQPRCVCAAFGACPAFLPLRTLSPRCRRRALLRRIRRDMLGRARCGPLAPCPEALRAPPVLRP
eukprot:15437639-Alexandrium_andersonii.AAC.1